MRQNHKNIVVSCIIVLFVISLYLIYARLNRVDIGEKTNVIPDTIVAVTISSSTTFFEYKGIYMGFQYELFDSFCKKINRPYKIKTVNNYDKLFDYLESGLADICITPVYKDKNIRNKFNFVGQKNTSSINLISLHSNSISNIKDLIGDTITVPYNTIYYKRIEQLNQHIGGGINIKFVDQDSLSTEDLIRMVSNGTIKYTLSDEYLAKLSNTYYSNISTSYELGFKRNQYWIVPKKKTLLTDAINKWSESLVYKNNINNIYKKYFEISKGFDTYNNNNLDEISNYRSTGRLTNFDEIFKQEAKKLAFDWTLLSAIAWQESRFNPSIVGWSGARGLMGIMPSTGALYNVDKSKLLDPQISVTVSVKCILDTKKYLGIKQYDENSIAIILAGYNAGIGHIMDAKRLAEKFNYNPDLWYDNLENCIKMKSNPKYYNDPVCKFGYLRSEETLKYVNSVLDKYRYYNTIINSKNNN